jgi:adenine deaminase
MGDSPHSPAPSPRDLGVTVGGVMMTLSFLGLAVIPSLRLTDHGLVDVVAARIVPFEVAA